LKILESLKLKFNNYSDSNDNFETKKLFINIFEEFSKEGIKDFSPGSELFCEYRILCFSKDKKPVELDSLVNRGCALLNLWAMNAQNDKGLCFVIDREEFVQEVNRHYSGNSWAFEVKYKDLVEKDAYEQRIDVSTMVKQSEKKVDELLRDYIKYNFKIMFFLKDKCHECENEFRVVLNGQEKETDSYIDLSFSLKGLILGHEVAPEFINILKPLCEKSNIFIKRLNFTDHFFLEETG
jgi:hypothetical protein